MAKAKSGGTRSYIRGRVGADVYSIGKDGLGNKQQVVRSLAETVANPQTEAQMRGRMIMSTVMQAVAEMSGIIDHSFDGVVKGQPSISEFIRRNYALIKADVAANPSRNATFGLVPYREKGMQPGNYVVSDGEVELTGVWYDNSMGSPIEIELGDDTTMGHLAELWGLSKEDYVTLLTVDPVDPSDDYSPVNLWFARMRIVVDTTDTTQITSANLLSAFDIEGNHTPKITLSTDTIVINLQDNESSLGFYGKTFWILSKKTDSGYIHSSMQFNFGSAESNNCDHVLPTYPQGGELFLNGGDI